MLTFSKEKPLLRSFEKRGSIARTPQAPRAAQTGERMVHARSAGNFTRRP
jgi:hypothetical protein